MALSRRRTSGPFGIAASVAALTLATAACYEVLAAAGLLEIGNEPGEGTAGEIVVSVAAATGFLIAVATLALTAARGRAPRDRAFVVLPLAAAAYMVARFYTYDPYYAPSFRRASEDGLVSQWWVFGLAVAACAAAVAVRLARRLGVALTVFVIATCGLTALVERGGH
jgi:hypothetical protein